jgi:hypothetical protein
MLLRVQRTGFRVRGDLNSAFRVQSSAFSVLLEIRYLGFLIPANSCRLSNLRYLWTSIRCSRTTSLIGRR